MSEPRRWTLHADNTWEPANDSAHESYVEEGTQVVEAAPVEAELERLRAENNGLYEQIAAAGEDVGEMEAELDRLRRIEAAAREFLGLVEDEDCVAGRACNCGSDFCRAANHLREALGEVSDA